MQSMRRLHSPLPVTAGLGLLLAACGDRPCSDSNECTVLTVEGAVPNTPTRMELLDAAGRRLGRYKTTTSNPEKQVQVRPDGFSLSEVACMRVRSGDANSRHVALVPIAPNDPLTPSGRTVTLKPVTAGAVTPSFRLYPYMLNAGESARSVTIGVLPQSNKAVVYVGIVADKTTLRSVININQFQDMQLAPLFMRQQLMLGNIPPYPIATARTTNGEQDLVVGRWSGDPPGMMTQNNWPVTSHGANQSYDNFSSISQYIPIPMVSSAKANYVTLAQLNNNGKPDLLIGYDDGASSGVLLATSRPGEPNAPFDVSKTPIATAASRALSGSVFLGSQPDGSLGIGVSLGGTVQLLSYDPAKQTTLSMALLSAGENLLPLGLAAGDFDGDDLVDLAATINTSSNLEFQQRLRLWTTRGIGKLHIPSSADIPTVGQRPRVAVAGDLNGDQIDDIVTADYGGDLVASARLSRWLGGSNAPRADDLVTGFTASKLLDVAIGDINGDCKLDLVAVSEVDPTVYVFINTTP